MKTPYRATRFVHHFIFGLFLLLVIPYSVSLAQTITSSGLDTAVSAPIHLPSGQTHFDITGGARPGGGTNLFHSFGDFNVPNNNVANFLNDSGLATSNILGRVTGGDVSNIFGTIQTTGFGHANLFLMNPAGFLFGPNATVNVGGIVTFTGANYLKLADGVRFNASPSASADSLLSTAPVAAFGFLGSNPGAITVQGSQLSVRNDAGISLVGGNIRLRGGTLTAPNGDITLISVDRPSNATVGGEVAVATSGQGAGFTPTDFRSLGTIKLSQGSTLDVSGHASNADVAGSVVIRGGQFVMNGSSLNAGFIGNGPIDVGSVISTAGGTHSDGGGAVTVQGPQGSGTFAHAGSLTKTSDTSSSLSDGSGESIVDLQAGTRIDVTASHIAIGSQGFAHGGSITMAAPLISLRGSTLHLSNTGAAPGTISLTATKAVNLTNGTILSANSDGQGQSGTIRINGGDLFMGRQSTISALGPLFSGNHGMIQVEAKTGRLTGMQLTTSSSGGPQSVAGSITVETKDLTLKHSQILSTATEGHGGTINITSPVLHRDASTVTNASSQSGTDGTVKINGREHGPHHLDEGSTDSKR